MNSYENRIRREEFESRQRYIKAARVKQVRMQKSVLFLISFLFILFFTLFLISKMTYANENESVTKQYKSITIYCGDSVASISEDFATHGYTSYDKYAKEICSINHISRETTLIPGNHIIIPYYEYE